MKSVSKPKDFSINSILADVSFQNDQYKNASVLNVSVMCENDTRKEKFERKPTTTAFKINIEDKIGLNTINNVESAEKNFDVTSNKMYLINNVYDNDDVSETKKYGMSLQLRNEEKYHRNEQCTYLLNTIENVANHFHPVFETIENCTPSVNVNRLIIVEGKSGKNNRNLSVLFKQREFNFNETNGLNRTENECVINSKYLKAKEEFEEISEHHVKVNKHQKKVLNSENQKKIYEKNEDKQLRKDEEKNFGNGEIKWLNSNYGNLLENENGGSKTGLYKKLEIIGNKYSTFNSPDEKTIKILNETENLETIENTMELEWLRYTRYKPPKIPRKSAVGKNRRKPCLHPRIPFSTFQLNFLQQQFRTNAYLSKHDVSKIANLLNLSADRVCIILCVL